MVASQTLDRTSVPQIPGVSRPLPPKWRDMLVSGDHGYPSRSEAVAALTLAMVNHGWTWIEYHEAMSDPDRHQLADWYYKRGARSGHRTRSSGDVFTRMERTWDHAVQLAQDRPAIMDRQSARQTIGLIRAEYLLRPFTGRTRVTDSLVLECFHQVATQRGRVSLTLSVRDVSLSTGIVKDTVSRSIHRLVKAGWLRKVNPSGRRLAEAQEYRLTTPHPVKQTECTDDTQDQHTTRTQAECTDRTLTPKAATGRTTSVRSVHSLVGHDAFLGLGRYAALVYAVTGEEGLRAEDVAEQAGVARRTAFKHLKSLGGLGMVESREGLWFRLERALEDVAEDLGMTGTGALRASRVDMERKAYSVIAEKQQYLLDAKQYGHKVAAENRRKTRLKDIPDYVDPVTGEDLRVVEEKPPEVVSGIGQTEVTDEAQMGGSCLLPPEETGSQVRQGERFVTLAMTCGNVIEPRKQQEDEMEARFMADLERSRQLSESHWARMSPKRQIMENKRRVRKGLEPIPVAA